MTKREAKYQPNAENIIAVRNLLASIFGTKNPTLKAVILAVLVFILAGWLPDTLSLLIGLLFKDNASFLLIIKAVIVVGLIIYFFKELKKVNIHFSPLEVRVEDNPAQAKVLLLFLSPIGPKDKADDRMKLLDNLYNPSVDEETNKKEVDKFMSDDFTRWPWYMPIKAIEKHLARLEIIYIITSKQTCPQYEYFQKLFDIYLKYYGNSKKVELSLWPNDSDGEEFSDIRHIFNLVNSFYDEMYKHNYKNNDIIVDVTGGMVPTSIGATMATLAKGRTAQYVSTMDYKVRTYDLTYREED